MEREHDNGSEKRSMFVPLTVPVEPEVEPKPRPPVVVHNMAMDLTPQTDAADEPGEGGGALAFLQIVGAALLVGTIVYGFASSFEEDEPCREKTITMKTVELVDNDVISVESEDAVVCE